MTWQPGTRLNQYQIDRVLGSGGFGITYKAIDLRLKHRVVIKTINDTLHRDPEYDSYVERFQREAEILAKLGELNHPHIVRVNYLFEVPVETRFLQETGFLGRFWQVFRGTERQKLPCLVMDFIDGENLFEQVRDGKKPLDEREALKYIQQAGDALNLVHRAGLVHRDAHPGNIMIRNGNAILIDFGLAGSIIPTVMSSKMGGNPAFAPPDQWRGNREPNVDIYTLAMSLYFVLTADTPDPFTEPKAKNSSISDRTNAAILKAIDLKPNQRPQSIADWFKLLGLSLSPAALQDLPDLSQPDRRKTGKTRRVTGSAKSAARRFPWRVAIFGGVAALALITALNLPFRFPETSVTVSGLPSGSPTLVPSSEAPTNPPPTQEPPSPTPEPPTPPPPTPTPEPPRFLGLEVEPYRYTSTRVSFTGTLSPYEATGQRYTETALNLPAGAVPLEMVAIDGGTFLMGQTEAEKQQLIQEVGQKDYDNYYDDEGPQHRVTVPDFLMGRYEVTQAQWFAVMGSDYNGNGWQEKWRSLDSRFKGDNLPIVYVSWDDAQEFIRRLNRLTGKTYRLPTESEWEYAARAETETPFSYGETITPEVVNYDGNYPYGRAPKGEYREKTMDVDSLYPNPWGLYHIHGNVWEWVVDGYHDNYNGAPTDGTAWLSSDEFHVLRGGSWYNNARITRSANRDRRYNWGNINGFRVLLSSRAP